jgi:hypothetical protein
MKKVSGIIIIRMIKSRRMGLVGHLARMGETRNVYSILVGKPEGTEDVGVDEKIILEWILGK